MGERMQRGKLVPVLKEQWLPVGLGGDPFVSHVPPRMPRRLGAAPLPPWTKWLFSSGLFWWRYRKRVFWLRDAAFGGAFVPGTQCVGPSSLSLPEGQVSSPASCGRAQHVELARGVWVHVFIFLLLLKERRCGG